MYQNHPRILARQYVLIPNSSRIGLGNIKTESSEFAFFHCHFHPSEASWNDAASCFDARGSTRGKKISVNAFVMCRCRCIGDAQALEEFATLQEELAVSCCATLTAQLTLLFLLRMCRHSYACYCYLCCHCCLCFCFVGIEIDGAVAVATSLAGDEAEATTFRFVWTSRAGLASLVAVGAAMASWPLQLVPQRS